VNSSEEYFENSRATGEIQYALQSVDTEKADSERVEKMLGDVKQKLEQVTRNVNTLNSAQSNMKEEFIRKQDIVSFRKELLNHLEEDISTAGKRQGILH
jgi:t-SNARE complex subunit (syntaxin)